MLRQEFDAEFVEALVRSGLTDRVVPVFESVESGTKMVLLDEVIIDLPEGVTPEAYFADSRFAGYTRLSGTPDQYVAKIAEKFGAEALDVIAELQREERTDWLAPSPDIAYVFRHCLQRESLSSGMHSNYDT
jgi:hypothetical protein